jgi:hypothetical protein
MQTAARRRGFAARPKVFRRRRLPCKAKEPVMPIIPAAVPKELSMTASTPKSPFGRGRRRPARSRRTDSLLAPRPLLDLPSRSLKTPFARCPLPSLRQNTAAGQYTFNYRDLTIFSRFCLTARRQAIKKSCASPPEAITSLEIRNLDDPGREPLLAMDLAQLAHKMAPAADRRRSWRTRLSGY